MRVFDFRSCGWMPIVLSSLMLIGILCSYIWAVVREDVEPFVPFISDAGGSPPQSGFFGIFLFLSAFMGTITMTVRYYSVRQECLAIKPARYINNGSIVLGFISLVGMIVVAAYPINTIRGQDAWNVSIALPHTLGAFSTFIVGVCYAICQTALTFLLRMKSQLNALILVAVRGTVCLFAIVAVIVMISYRSGDSNNSASANTTITPTNTTPMTNGQWDSSSEKMVNSIAEWVLAIMLIAFFLTLYPELQNVRFSAEIENFDDNMSRESQESLSHQEYGSTVVTQSC